MSIRSSRIRLQQFRYESYDLLKQLHRSLQLLNSATQLASREPVISKTDPKIQHSKHDDRIGIRSISDRRSKNQLLSFLFCRSLNLRFPRDEVHPTSEVFRPICESSLTIR
ncbi:hypothetical protein AVEN_264768-1 [Araneus ventricosus]|uniref:Uncharacterized protein n=1 Tax=Araneus ventricosus TaxID=182803 RepID=A0A4Y2ECV2_ARAVE|nr:hypothetical protein AVEN_264768-1 [Araneus ventricosus]